MSPSLRNSASRLKFPARYAVVSGLTWLIDLAAFALLYSHISPAAAMVVARCVAAAFAFPAQRWGAFGARGQVSRHEVVGYGLLWGFNLGVATALVAGGALLSEADALPIKIGVELLLFVANYLFLRRLFLPRA